MKKLTCEQLVDLGVPEITAYLWGGPHDLNATLVSLIDDELPVEIWVPWLGNDRKVRPPRVARYVLVSDERFRGVFYRFVGEQVATSPDDLGAAFYEEE